MSNQSNLNLNFAHGRLHKTRPIIYTNIHSNLITVYFGGRWGALYYVWPAQIDLMILQFSYIYAQMDGSASCSAFMPTPALHSPTFMSSFSCQFFIFFRSHCLASPDSLSQPATPKVFELVRHILYFNELIWLLRFRLILVHGFGQLRECEEGPDVRDQADLCFVC